MRRAPFLTIALAALACSASADAATWSAPQTLSAPHTFAGPPLLAPQAEGRLVVAWPWQDDIGNDAIGGEGIATRPAAGAAFGPESRALDGLVAISPYARAQTLSLAAQGLPTRDANGNFLSRLRVAFDAGTPRTLATVPLFRAPALASAQTSTRALVAFVQPTRTASGAIRRIVRTIDRAGGRWSAPTTIAGTGRADVVTAAANARGDQVVAFSRQGRVLARVRRSGHGWGSLRTLATSTPASRTTFALAAAVDARGQVRVLWRRHVYRGAISLQTAAMLVGRSTFTTPQTLVADGASGVFRIVQAPGGWAVATVRTDANGPRPVIARTSGGSAFGAAFAVAPVGGGLRDADLTASADGSITVAWLVPLPGQDGGGIARSATLPAGGTTFGPVEDVTPPETVSAVRLAPGPTAIFVSRPTAGATLVRAATRTP
jgi:hypothetical protein